MYHAYLVLRLTNNRNSLISLCYSNYLRYGIKPNPKSVMLYYGATRYLLIIPPLLPHHSQV